MKFPVSSRRASGFTLVEMMIVISIIVVLAAMTIGGYNYAMRGSKRRTTEATMTAITSSLERYFEKNGEYPEPATKDEFAPTMPGKVYNVGGARCLYQALRGDGYDAIKGAGNTASGGNSASDGNFDETEVLNVMFKDMPPTMWRKLNGLFFMVDGFSNPFQYVKAPSSTTAAAGAGGAAGGGASVTTINATYDLWSYGEDVLNTSAKSSDTIGKPEIAAKWIKNW
ncbi:MAG: prepilin-type N-terminal cleavage/methylation domain-containing protein [Verrucomicrobiaceae bacterium]